MTPEERELRRALDSRSAEITPEYRAKLASALAEGSRWQTCCRRWLRSQWRSLCLQQWACCCWRARLEINHPVTTTTPVPCSRQHRPRHLRSSPGVLTKPPAPIALPTQAQLTAPSSDVRLGAHTEFTVPVSLDRSRQALGTASSATADPRWSQALEVSFVEHPGGLADHRRFRTGRLSAAQRCGYLWHTTDAGATWQLLGTNGVSDRQCKDGFRLSIPIAVSSTPGTQITPPVIYRTTDGGRTWTGSQPLPDPPGYQDGRRQHHSAARTCPCLSDRRCLFQRTGRSSGATDQDVFRSTDGGATWASLTAPPPIQAALALVTASRWPQFFGPGQSIETRTPARAGTCTHPTIRKRRQSPPSSSSPIRWSATPQLGAESRERWMGDSIGTEPAHARHLTRHRHPSNG